MKWLMIWIVCFTRYKSIVPSTVKNTYSNQKQSKEYKKRTVVCGSRKKQTLEKKKKKKKKKKTNFLEKSLNQKQTF